MNQARDGNDGRMGLEQSPIHRAVWERELPLELFGSEPAPMPAAVRERLDRSLEVVRRRRAAKELYDERGVVSEETAHELAGAGYWGLRVPEQHGGAGASFRHLAQALTEMVLADPWIAGLGSTQAGLGPVSSLLDFGTPGQQERLLPPLARGERLGAFAMTEPRGSSDLGRMITSARHAHDQLLVTGEKLFISNAAPGRTITLLCWLDGRLEVLVAELPSREDERFQVVPYTLRAPAHLPNAGLRFRELPVPVGNLLVPGSGDGRTIAFRALNHGRVAVGATVAGMLRRIAGSLIPWVRQRETFGAPLATRELVQHRLGRLAARVVACDALTAWGASLLDQGYRGELECVALKVFASEALKEATTDILLKTHAGRSFLEGNLFAESVHDLLAPTIYEGENDVLTLGFFARLGKAHAARYLAPLSQAVRKAGFERADFGDPRQLWAARQPLASYAAWLAPHEARRLLTGAGQVPTDLDGLSECAGRLLHDSALELSHALQQGPRAQVLAHAIGRRVQRAAVLLVVSRYAARQTDPLVRIAGECMAVELAQELLGARPSTRSLRLVTLLGAEVAQDHFAPVAGAEREPVAMGEELTVPPGGATPLGGRRPPSPPPVVPPP